MPPARENRPYQGARKSGFTSSLADLGSDTTSGSGIDINPDISNSSYLFYDGTSYYKTLDGGGGTNQIVRFGTLADLATNTSGTTFSLSQAWSANDDFYADGLGNYYRNASPGGGTNGTTKYTSFTDLVNNTNGVFNSFSTTFAFDDRFFAYQGVFYRTNTNGGNVTGFAVYNSFADLLSHTVAQTVSAQVAYSKADNFVAVPEPTAIAALGCGAAAVGLSLRRAAGRRCQRPTAAAARSHFVSGRP